MFILCEMVLIIGKSSVPHDYIRPCKTRFSSTTVSMQVNMHRLFFLKENQKFPKRFKS